RPPTWPARRGPATACAPSRSACASSCRPFGPVRSSSSEESAGPSRVVPGDAVEEVRRVDADQGHHSAEARAVVRRLVQRVAVGDVVVLTAGVVLGDAGRDIALYAAEVRVLAEPRLRARADDLVLQLGQLNVGR